MRLISPPGEHLTEVAGQLLESARLLGLQPGVVETTTGAEFGYGFTVPDDVFDHWFLRRGEASGAAAAPVEEFSPEVVVPEVPEAEVPRKKTRGVKPVTEGSEA